MRGEVTLPALWGPCLARQPFTELSCVSRALVRLHFPDPRILVVEADRPSMSRQTDK